MPIDEPLGQQTPNPTGRGGTLGLLAQRLSQGINNRKKKTRAQQVQSQQGLSSQVLGNKEPQVGGLNPPIL